MDAMSAQIGQLQQMALVFMQTHNIALPAPQWSGFINRPRLDLSNGPAGTSAPTASISISTRPSVTAWPLGRKLVAPDYPDGALMLPNLSGTWRQIGQLQQMALAFMQTDDIALPPAPQWSGLVDRPRLDLSGGPAGTSAPTASIPMATSTPSVTGVATSPMGRKLVAPDGAPTEPNLSGTWIKDRARSDSTDDTSHLMQLSGVVRQAVKLVRGVKLDMNDDHFTITVFTFLPWFKVTEKYALSGAPGSFRRRDLRRGKHVGTVEKNGKEVHLKLEWDEPFGGRALDVFDLHGSDELVVDSTINVRGQTAKCRTVYTRKGHHD